jgi:hypothetical protein
MTTDVLYSHCQADHRCNRTPCFEAQLVADGGMLPIHRNAELCADHLGDMVQALTAWARSLGLTRGQVTVLAIDPTWHVRTADQARPCKPFQFAAIPLT